jgi:glycosyltransferase involved in cell wall biosynthesis
MSLAGFGASRPASVYTYELAEYLSRNYVGARVDAPRVLATPRGFAAAVQAVRSVRRILRGIRPDLFHIHSAGTYGLLGALAGFHPLIVTPWGSDVLISAASPLKRPVVRFALRRADAITCDAEHMRGAMMRLGIPPAKIRIIYFGTNTAKFRPGLDEEEIRRRYGMGGGPVIISTRSLLPVYDVASLISALPVLFREVPGARCIIVGDGCERDSLTSLAAVLGVTGRVRFVGPVAGDEIPRYLGAADIYVSTSLSDAGLAASTAEAMACGLPVVVTDSAENDAWVAEGLGGFLVPVRRPDVLAAKIIYLALHPEERKRFGAYNRRVIEQRNNYEVEMGKVERLYESIARTCGAA